MPVVHPSAVVDPNADLADDVVVGPVAVIEAGTVIGAGTRIGPGAVILSGTRLGKNCRVHAHAVLGDLPQDLSFEGIDSFVEAGDDCVFREGVTVHRGTKEGTFTRLGRHCYLMANSHLAHNVRMGDEVILANGVLLGGYVDVGDRAFLGGGAGVHQFCRVGRLTMIGGLAGISKDVPPFCTAASNRRNRVLGLNVIGLRRAGFSPEHRREIKEAYQMLYQRTGNLEEAMAAIRGAFPESPALEMADFTAASTRGICTPRD